MRAAGHDVHVIAVDEEASDSLILESTDKKMEKISAGALSKLLKILKKSAAKFAIMAGQVRPKKLFSRFPDVRAMLMLASLKERNAATVFGAIAGEIEGLGVQLLDARSFMWDSIATAGPMSRGKSKISDRDLEFGVHIAREVERLNIGQSLAVRRGTTIAVEDFAGTDDLIGRIGKFGLGDVLFVKTSKFQQDFRFDVPVFGIKTLENLRDASVKYVALEAGSVIILNKPNVMAAARRYAIEIVGF
jgi:DUF1009 family protein